jgi:hypothetical protein
MGSILFGERERVRGKWLQEMELCAFRRCKIGFVLSKQESGDRIQ